MKWWLFTPSPVFSHYLCEVACRVKVYAKLVVEVDASCGGCESGDEKCTAYADCNPRSCPKSDPDCPIEWHCDCGANGAATIEDVSGVPPGRAEGKAAPYWQCSDALAETSSTAINVAIAVGIAIVAGITSRSMRISILI